MTGATPSEQAAMVYSVVGIGAVDALTAADILCEYSGLSPEDSARLLVEEQERRAEEAEVAYQDDDMPTDGPWGNDWGGWAW